ncbi:MAG: hypothetical protein KJO29_02315, partial [Bacteroidia bacterium]|nr:hypothetical protein [Bacteroidia bacterium]
MAVNQSIEQKTNPPALYKGLTVHLILLVILLLFCGISWSYFEQDLPALFWITIFIPVIHQAYVWICWRTEILNKSVSKTIGFNLYLKVFFVLLFLRPLTLLA